MGKDNVIEHESDGDFAIFVCLFVLIKEPTDFGWICGSWNEDYIP